MGAVVLGRPKRSNSSVDSVVDASPNWSRSSENEKGVGGAGNCEDTLPVSAPHASEEVGDARVVVFADHATLKALRELFVLIMRQRSPGWVDAFVSEIWV